MKKENLVIGRVRGGHGIHGELAVTPLTDDPARFGDLDYFIIDGVSYTLTSYRPHKTSVLLTSPQIPDRTAADKLRGKYVEIRRRDGVPLNEGEYYIEDLKGLEVIDTSPGSTRRGKLVDVITAGGADVLVISLEGREVMMVFLNEDVAQIDVEGGFMRADLSKAQ